MVSSRRQGKLPVTPGHTISVVDMMDSWEGEVEAEAEDARGSM